MSKSLLKLEESKTFTKALFEAIQKSPIEIISKELIANPENNPYRPSDRLHDSNEDQEAVDNLSAQLDELSLLHPLVVVDEGDSAVPLFIASGVKRLKAARDTVAVKRIKLADICNHISSGWSLEKRRAALSEALQNVVFTESETNTELSDQSVVSLLRTIKSNQDIEAFNEVMPRIGLKRDNSSYRNIKRLWGVVANEQLFSSYADGTIPLEIAKLDTTQKIFDQTDKREQLLERIRDYRSELIQNDPDNATKKMTEDMKGYSKTEVDFFVRDVAQREAEENETFSNPVFDIEVKDSYVTIPKIDKLSVTDTSRQNIAKVLDVYYNLSVICDQLQGYLDAVKPDEVGGLIKKERAITFSVEPAEYGEHYLKFLHDRNMHFYAKSSSIDSHFEELRDLLIKISDRQKIKKSELPSKIVGTFIERLKSGQIKVS